MEFECKDSLMDLLGLFDDKLLSPMKLGVSSPNPFLKMGATNPFLTEDLTELQTKARALKAEENSLRETISPVQTVPSPAECTPSAVTDSVPDSHRRQQQQQQIQQQMQQMQQQLHLQQMQQQQQQQFMLQFQLQQQQQQQQQRQQHQQQQLQQQFEDDDDNNNNDNNEDDEGSDAASDAESFAKEQQQQQQQQQQQHKRKKVLGGLVARNKATVSPTKSKTIPTDDQDFIPQRSSSASASASAATTAATTTANAVSASSGRSTRTRQAPRRLIDTYARPEMSDSEFEDDESDAHGLNRSSSSVGSYHGRDSNNNSSSGAAAAVDEDDFASILANNDMDDFRIEHISEREQKQLREQLKRRLKELETCTDEMKGLSSGERKKLRNRKASCVSRLKKKLILAELADHLERQKEKIKNTVAMCEFYRQESDQLFRRLQRYEPSIQRTPAPTPESLSGNSSSRRADNGSPAPRPANVGHITKRSRSNPCNSNASLLATLTNSSSSNSGYRAAERTSSNGSASGQTKERDNCFCNSSKTGQMIQCDSCHSWFHFDCVGISKNQVDADFICRDCRE